MQLSVGPPLAGVPFSTRTIRRGDERQPYTNGFLPVESYEVISTASVRLSVHYSKFRLEEPGRGCSPSGP